MLHFFHMHNLIRINKYLRDKGVASRREADGMISAGLVMVNGKRAEPGMLISGKDDVKIGKGHRKQYEYWAYYKPRGLATQGLKGDASVIEDWKDRGVFPLGRLDKESEGLLLLTNDGRITETLVGKGTAFTKEYIVTTKEKLRQGIPAIFERGMRTEVFGKLKPAEATIINSNTLRVVLHEGKRHQIRVMLSELHCTIEELKRVRIGHIRLGNLRSGQSRPLTQEEVALFFVSKNKKPSGQRSLTT